MMNEYEKKIMLEISNLEAGAKCMMYDYGSMNDCCAEFSANFVGGNAYGIIGEFGSGGWALSYTLTGNKSKNDCITNGTIKIDGKIVTLNELKKISCYVGEEGIKTKWLGLKKMSVLEQLRTASIDNEHIDIDKIIEEFQLSHERVNRPVQHLSGERWNASMAIGYALNKKIYCFPWFNSGWMYRLRPRLQACFDVLKKNGAIIILPTANIKSVADIVDVTMHIKVPNDILLESQNI